MIGNPTLNLDLNFTPIHFKANFNSSTTEIQNIFDKYIYDKDINNIQNINTDQGKNKSQKEIEMQSSSQAIISEENIYSDFNKNSSSKTYKSHNWYLKIPCINLQAEISEGTTKEIMNQFVGHFEESSKTEGIIGLAAHNRGYAVNYFENLKKLKIGDEIEYFYNNFNKKYIVEKHSIIKDTDWSWLEEKDKKNKNYIVLITCVENEPEYRRCIQAIEKF